MPKIETDAKGIPLKSDHPAIAMGIPVWLFYLVFNSLFTAIGLATAVFAIFPREPASAKVIATLAAHNYGFIYLGAWVLKLGAICQGIFLGTMRSESKVIVPDQHVYKVQGAEGSKLGYVLMETDGAHGAFNRAQRSVQNYNENFPLFVLMFLLAGCVCPFSTFVCTCIFAAGRVLNSIGYAGAAEGRVGGMMLGLLASCVIDAIVLVVGVQAM